MSKLTSFILGGMVGAAAVFFLTPRTGEQNRALVTERANALVGEAKDLTATMPDAIQDTYRTAVDQGTAFVNSAVQKGTDLVNDAAARVKEVTGQVSQEADTDELRDKIEAARQRIASQVMENAEQAKAAGDKAAATINGAVEVAAKKADAAAGAAGAKVEAAVEDAEKKAQK